MVCLLSSTTSSTSCCQSSFRELIDSGALQLLDAKCRLRLCSDLACGLQAIHAQGNGMGWHGMIRDDTCFVVREAGGLTAKLSVCDALDSADSALPQSPIRASKSPHCRSSEGFCSSKERARDRSRRASRY